MKQSDRIKRVAKREQWRAKAYTRRALEFEDEHRIADCLRRAAVHRAAAEDARALYFDLLRRGE